MAPHTTLPSSPRSAGRVTPARSVATKLGLSLAAVVLAAAPAYSHGDVGSTIPEAGSTLKGPPDHLIINFTEPPAKPSVVVVHDGCNDNIIDEVEFEDRVAHVYLTDGQPGTWKVSYQVVSAADGHRTKGSYALKVQGKADCSDKPENGGGGGNGNDAGDEGTAAGPRGGGGTDADESPFPMVPVALGSAAVIVLALVARRLSG